ncbi:MAG TPA: NAD(P)-dependent oxidoreductase [Candidatus Eisenbacteria bacterium]|nr:NAD(P)-dependent oxidoreductase [Candidatus Eisenbacteria bacterium]
MKVVVTGGSGRLGRHLVRHLVERGYQVLSLDRAPPPEPLCPSWMVDLTRASNLYEALRGAGGVVHLGAYQAPNLAPDTETFANNITATYNVLKAAADLGVKRVVIGSSIAAYGFLYAPALWTPEYLPLDEHHPCRPQDPYGLSKKLGEEIADSFAVSHPMTISSLRLAGINFDPTFETFPQRWLEPEKRRNGFWSYVDVRDAVTACRLALERDHAGHEIFNVAAPTSAMREPTAELIRRFIPDLKRVNEGVTENWSGLDSSKAQKVLGLRCEHLWQDYLGRLKTGAVDRD